MNALAVAKSTGRWEIAAIIEQAMREKGVYDPDRDSGIPSRQGNQDDGGCCTIS